MLEFYLDAGFSLEKKEHSVCYVTFFKAKRCAKERVLTYNP